MRGILFRGKRSDNGEWVEGGICEAENRTVIATINFFAGSQYEPPAYYAEDIDAIPSTVGQYTGLTDKNGVKIFEGDIIKHKENLFEIRYSTNQARYLALLPNGVFNPVAMQNCEVIGNVYDDPELLKGEEL